MPRKSDDELMLARHKAMLEFQDEIKPFTPTLRDLLYVWSVDSTNTVRYTLMKLEAVGLVISKRHGTSNSYYAVKPLDTPAERE